VDPAKRIKAAEALRHPWVKVKPPLLGFEVWYWAQEKP
jgi:hypothetical protein